MNTKTTFIIFIVFILAGSTLAAQITTGTILGTVTDQTAARLPGVEVLVTNVGTGSEHTILTDEEGSYRVGSLEPGEYTVRALLPGFKLKTVRGIVLQVN